MNIVIKLLPLLIASLSTLVAPVKGHDEDIKTEILTIHKEVKPKCTDCKNEIIVKILQKNDVEKAIDNMNQKMSEIEIIEDREEWFIAYKNIIDEYSYIIDPPETIYDYFTDEELDLLFHVVQAEIGDEYSFEEKVNVASVIFNRIDNENFPGTMSEVLCAGQFQVIANNKYRDVEVSNTTILACEYAFQIEDTSNGALFFDSNNTLSYEFIFKDDAHNFYTLRGNTD